MHAVILGVVYTVPVPESVADIWGSVWTQDAGTLAFYATEQQCDALLFELVQVAPPHDFCNVPIASENSST